MLLIFLGVISEEEQDLVKEFFSKMSGMMYQISYNKLKSKADAEEAVSETFLKITENIKKISTLPCPQIEPYCVMILKNETINIIRKRKKSIDVEDIDYLMCDDQSYNFENEVIEIVDWEYLISHMDKLSDDEKEFVHLRFYNEMNYKEISNFFDISEEATKKRGQRILRKLRLSYEGGGENIQIN
ncbi:MAG: sigma-70 family RNA polymerase sigma factor [Acetivibrio sp.]